MLTIVNGLLGRSQQQSRHKLTDIILRIGELSTRVRDGEWRMRARDGEWRMRGRDGEWRMRGRDGEWRMRARDGEWRMRGRDGEWRMRARDGEWRMRGRDGEWRMRDGEWRMRASIDGSNQLCTDIITFLFSLTVQSVTVKGFVKCKNFLQILASSVTSYQLFCIDRLKDTE